MCLGGYRWGHLGGLKEDHDWNKALIRLGVRYRYQQEEAAAVAQSLATSTQITI